MRKARAWLFLAVFWGWLCAGSACAQSVAFTDDTGEAVAVSSPERVAALSGSLADLWQLAGGQLTFATRDAWTERALDLSGVMDVGSLKQPSAETLLAGGVDFALLTPTLEGQRALGQTLRDAGVTVAYGDLETFDDYLRLLRILTDITGRPDRYELYGTQVAAQVEGAIAGCAGKPAPKVLLLRAYGSGVKAKNSENNLTGAILKALGCVNIADSESGLLEDLSLEQILVSDPDFIFLTEMGDEAAALQAFQTMLADNPAWAHLTAVQEGRFEILPKELFHYKPNARWGESYEYLAERLYGAA